MDMGMTPGAGATQSVSAVTLQEGTAWLRARPAPPPTQLPRHRARAVLLLRRLPLRRPSTQQLPLGA
eukprot:2564128-Alexandrium_andersonii.AAC.1